MGRKRIRRYSEVESYDNFINVNVTGFDPVVLDKTWDSDFFGNDNGITLELGCGRGEYTLNLARRYPERNFIGIDVKGDRLCIGARTATEENLPNVLFIRIKIENILNFLPESCIHEAWIPFPDPYSRNESGKKRLTSQRFLDMYRKLIIPGGHIHLKTDDTTLYYFSKESIGNSPAEIIHDTKDLYGSDIDHPEVTTIHTTYEKRYLAESKTIKYISFAFK